MLSLIRAGALVWKDEIRRFDLLERIGPWVATRGYCAGDIFINLALAVTSFDSSFTDTLGTRVANC